MNASQRNTIKVILRLVLTGLILVLLSRVIDRHALMKTLRGTILTWLLLMYAVRVVQQVVEALRMRCILSRMGAPVPLSRILLSGQVAAFYALVMPGEIASSGAKWAALSSASGKRGLVFGAMLYNRLIQTFLMLAVGTAALFLYPPPGTGTPLRTAAVCMMVGVAAGFAILYHPALHPFSNRVLALAARRLPDSLEKRLNALHDCLTAGRALHGAGHIRVLLWGTTALALGLTGFTLGMRALHIDAPTRRVVWVLTVMVLVQGIPITIGSLGVRESVLTFALVPLGATAEQAVGLGLLNFSTLVLRACAGALCQGGILLGWVRWSQDAPASPAADGSAEGSAPDDHVREQGVDDQQQQGRAQDDARLG